MGDFQTRGTFGGSLDKVLYIFGSILGCTYLGKLPTLNPKLYKSKYLKREINMNKKTSIFIYKYTCTQVNSWPRREQQRPGAVYTIYLGSGVQDIMVHAVLLWCLNPRATRHIMVQEFMG